MAKLSTSYSKEEVDERGMQEIVIDATPDIDPSIIKSGLESAIDELTPAQLCEALPVMLAANQSDVVPPAIAEQIKLWDDLGKSNLSLQLPVHIATTITAFYNYFKDEHGLDLESLKSNSPFARNMFYHSSESAICCYEMQLFCKYIALLSQKPLEIQKVFFDTFPPKTRDDIACLGGTGSRMSDLIDQLQASEEDRPFVETHKLLMSQLVDRFKFTVSNNLQVNVPQFLNHSFSLESPEELAKKDPCFSYPSFQMPAHILWEGIMGYASGSKKILKKSDALMKHAQDATKPLMEDLATCDLESALYDYESDGKGKEARNVILDKSGEVPVNELVEIKEEEGKEIFVWSKEKIAAAAAKKSWVKHKALKNEKSVSKQQELIDEISSGSAMFSSKTVDNIANLIKSEDRRDIQTGVELLWILGSKMKGNSPLQFMRVINAIGKDDNVGYLKDIARTKILPNHQLKLDKIIEDHKSYSKNPVILKRLNPQDSDNRGENELAVLASIGGTTEEIKHCIEGSGNKRLLKNSFSFGYSFAQNLSNRPDCLEIIKALQAKNIEFSSTLQKELLLQAVHQNQSETSLHILKNFELKSDIFRDCEILTRAMARKNKEVIEAVINKGGKRYLDFKSRTLVINEERHYGLAPIHCAAITGDEDLILALKEEGANMNLRTGTSVFYPNSWQPANPVHPFPHFFFLDPLFFLVTSSRILGGYLFSQTPMHLAASNGRASAIDALIKSGSEIDLPAYGHNKSISIRPLHCAIAGGYKAAAASLIEAGASLESKTVLEPSLASMAVRYNQPQCLELLIEKGMKIEPSEMNKLCSIACSGFGMFDNEMLNLLVKNGAFMPNAVTYGSGARMMKSSKTFEMVATAIMENATAEIVTPTPESRKELTKLQHEIYKTLIKTYDFKEADLIEDLALEADIAEFTARSGKVYLESDSFRKAILNKENIQKIGQIVKGKISVDKVEGSINGDDSLYNRIFSHSNAPKQIVGITQAEKFVERSLENRDSIRNTLAETQLTAPDVRPQPRTNNPWTFSRKAKIIPSSDVGL